MSAEETARAELRAELWEAYFADRCDETRNALVEAYQDLAREVARRFSQRLPRSVDRGDLTTAANFGLMSAIGGFDPERGVRFESYCELRVKGALLDELRTQDWLPRPWRHRLELQKRTLERLRSEGEREPTDQEMAAAMGMELKLYQQIFGVGLPGTPSGSMPGAEGGDEASLFLEVVPDPSCDAPGDSLTRDELLSLVTQRLADQEYRILYLRYWEGLSMREIGELTSLSESRVCKVHARLIERLQEHLRVHVDEA